MYITIQDAVTILGVSRVTIYSYIKKGLLEVAPDSKKTMIEVQSVYAQREKMRKGKNNDRVCSK